MYVEKHEKDANKIINYGKTNSLQPISNNKNSSHQRQQNRQMTKLTQNMFRYPK